MSGTSPFTKWARGQGDTLRAAYMTARAAMHLPDHLSRRRIVAGMNPSGPCRVADEDGYRAFERGTFPEAVEAAADAQRALAQVDAVLNERRQLKRRKQFLVNLLEPDSVTPDHPLVRLSLRSDLLEGISVYMRTVPLLRSIQVFYSGAAERDLTSSQLYHCDADDGRQLKIFVLCSDVARPNGPLTILDADRSQRVRQAVGYGYHQRLTDEQVEKVVGNHQPFELVGSPGAVCLVDTSRCFHYGSRVEPGAAPRLVAMVQYLSPFAFVLPKGPRAGASLAHLDHPGLNPLQRAVLTGDARRAS
ncbi:MAG TPA: hypothetical protein VIY56_07550 [Vicinamibacterales bacterium]